MLIKKNVILFVSALLLVIGCDSTESENAGKSLIPTRVVLNNPKSVFTGKSASMQNNVVATSIMYEVLNDDSIQEVKFVDENDNEITVNVTRLVRINESYLGIIFKYNDNEYKVIVNINDGIMLDFSDYNIETAKIINNNLYVLSRETIYRIDLNTNIATPMNNPVYDPVNQVMHDYFIVVNDENVFACSYCWGGYLSNIFFKDNSVPCHPSQPGLSLMDSLTNSGSCGLLIGNDGYLYNLLNTDGFKVVKCTFNKSGISEEIIMDDHTGQYFIGFKYSYNYDLYARKRYILYANGYRAVTRNQESGGFDCEFVERDFSSIKYAYSEGKLKLVNNTLYFKDGDAIQSFNLSSDTDFQEIITHPNIINWWVSGDCVMFTSYITATNVGTYKVNNGSAELISNSDMKIKNIVEFSEQ